MYNYTRDASRCLAILSINTSSSNEKNWLAMVWRMFAKASPIQSNVRRTFGDNCWLFAEMVGDISAILLRCIGEHQRSFGDASPRHQWKWGGGEGRRGGGDLYTLSWFMSVIFLYYFTCMFLSRVFVHFYCLLLFVQCTELMGYYTINNFYYYHYHYYY